MKRIGLTGRAKIALYISSVCMILSAAILVTTLTYSWIRRTWVTSVYEESIKVEANGALAFKLDTKDDVARDSLSILSVLNYKNFVFKPVSNFSGRSEDFFTIDRTVGGSELYSHLFPPETVSPTASAYQDLGNANGYIEFRFLLIGDEVRTNDEKNDENSTSGSSESTAKNYMKYVFLDAGSFFDAYDPNALPVNPADALRVSISVGDNYDNTWLFKNPDAQGTMVHTGVNNAKNSDGQWIVNGQEYWDGEEVRKKVVVNNEVTDIDIVKVNDEVLELSHFNGGIHQGEAAKGEDAEKWYVTPENCLGWFSPGGQMWISVRIWLEGTDPVCTDDIAGQRLKLYLNFKAYNCDPGTHEIIDYTSPEESSSDSAS